jgi:hypothetical protein
MLSGTLCHHILNEQSTKYYYVKVIIIYNFVITFAYFLSELLFKNNLANIGLNMNGNPVVKKLAILLGNIHLNFPEKENEKKKLPTKKVSFTYDACLN